MSTRPSDICNSDEFNADADADANAVVETEDQVEKINVNALETNKIFLCCKNRRRRRRCRRRPLKESLRPLIVMMSPDKNFPQFHQNSFLCCYYE